MGRGRNGRKNPAGQKRTIRFDGATGDAQR
jgi:hypothetical protein